MKRKQNPSAIIHWSTVVGASRCGAASLQMARQGHYTSAKGNMNGAYYRRSQSHQWKLNLGRRWMLQQDKRPQTYSQNNAKRPRKALDLNPVEKFMEDFEFASPLMRPLTLGKFEDGLPRRIGQNWTIMLRKKSNYISLLMFWSHNCQRQLSCTNDVNLLCLNIYYLS